MPRDDARRRRVPLDADRQALAVRHLPLARSLAKPFKRDWPNHRDEFDSAAMLALCEAAEAFNPSLGVKFSTFLHHRVWGALRDVQRAMIPLGYRGNPDAAPVVASMGRDQDHADRSEDPCEATDQADSVEAILGPLPRRSATIVRLVDVEGMDQAEAAIVVGLSRSRLSFLRREAIAILDGSWAESVRAG